MPWMPVMITPCTEVAAHLSTHLTIGRSPLAGDAVALMVGREIQSKSIARKRAPTTGGLH
jgi:hypothetical protein